MLNKFKMLDYLRISDGLQKEITIEANSFMRSLLDREVYSQGFAETLRHKIY